MKQHAIFTTHGISKDATTPTHLSIDDFKHFADICRLVNVSFKPLNKVDFLPSPENKDYLMQKTIRSITFDDALESILKAAEIMSAKGTIFVVTGHVGKYNNWAGQPAWVIEERCLGWSQLKELQNDGWTIGAHSETHANLNRLSANQIKNEIEFSKKIIEDRLGQPCDFFAYPYGAAPCMAREMVKELNMIGLGTEPGWVDLIKAELHCLPRIEIYDLIHTKMAKSFFYHAPTELEIQSIRLRRFFELFRRSLRQAV